MGDASFAPIGERSQQGLIVYHGLTSAQRLGGNLVQWRSSRQDLIAKSTCEAELIAPSEALQQGEIIATVVAEMTNQSCEIEAQSAMLYVRVNAWPSAAVFHTSSRSSKAINRVFQDGTSSARTTVMFQAVSSGASLRLCGTTGL